MAPDLVQIYNKYKSSGVEFIGLTAAARTTAEAYNAAFQIPWPSGYAAQETIEKLVGAGPTLFVIRRDGRIAWNDNSARLKHKEQDLVRQLDQAIEQALRTQ